MKRFVLAAAGVWLAGCSPSAPPAKSVPVSATVAESQPPEGWAATYPDCTWTRVDGAGVSMWGYQCPSSKLVADAALPYSALGWVLVCAC